MEQLFLLYAFLFGLLWGSFANVVIYRVPLELNFVVNRSFCPNCKKPIKWYENIPLLSYIFLRGKCSGCHQRIPLRYFIVELIAGFASMLLFPSNISLESILLYIFYFSVALVFICQFFIDLDHFILPHGLNFTLLVLFLTYSIIFHSWKWWLMGGLLGFGFPFIIYKIHHYITKKEGLGGGDIILYGVLGIYLGPVGIIHTIFLSCFIGSIIGIAIISIKKADINTHIPFGPYIIASASFQIFFHDYYSTLVGWAFK